MNDKEQGDMSIAALEKEILNIWQRALGKDDLTVDDDFFECGGDSLLATQVLLEIEQLTEKSLPTSIIFETGTVRLLSKVIETDNFETRVSLLAGPANGIIIHFFHGELLSGGGNITRTLSEMFGSAYLIHAISPHLPREGRMPDTIEEMAKERLRYVIEKQPDGPYILIGRCNGALVAFEAARQLILMGQKVKAVIMIDPTIMSVRRSAQLTLATADLFMRLTAFHKSRRHNHLIKIWKKLVKADGRSKDIWRRSYFFFHKTWHQKLLVLRYYLDDNINNLIHKKDKDNEETEEVKAIMNHYNNVLFHYKPLPLNLPLLYIALAYRGKAWRRITKNMNYINIYRGHHTSWEKDYSYDLVKIIQGFIN
ncbi:MAG: thioesterase domain-containing protein [Smithella sp.]|nr:thioesterase domain-containing protein [Smithella sp.]